MEKILIRDATNSDKSYVLDFCKNTFLWGDYIQDVWDYWLREGNLLLIEKEYPVGICHVFFSKNQVWLEGIRINSTFRRQGLATNLVKHAESIAKEKKLPFSFMLIDTENLPSLSMAKNLNYDIFQTWNFYSLLPQFNNYNIQLHNEFNFTKFPHYVNSWRWLVLDHETLLSLSKQNKIIFSNENGDVASAILTDSEHFDKTLIVTLFSGSKINTMNIILYIQNYGKENNYRKIQILTKEKLPLLKNLEYKIKFHLMQKFLC